MNTVALSNYLLSAVHDASRVAVCSYYSLKKLKWLLSKEYNVSFGLLIDVAT